MLRRLFTVLSALSLLLCVAVVVLWVRSYWVIDLYVWDRAPVGSTHHLASIASYDGNVEWVRQDPGKLPVLAPSELGWRAVPDWWGRRGWIYSRNVSFSGGSTRGLSGVLYTQVPGEFKMLQLSYAWP